MIQFIFACMLLLALPAIAQDANPQIRVEKGVCRYVTKHIPDADVDYKSGVDVHGKKVVPADLTPPMDYGLENSFYLRLTTDAVKAFGIKVPEIRSNVSGANPNAAGVTTDTVFGYITLKHGKAYLNGKPLDATGQSQLAVLCKSQDKSGE